MKYTINQKYPLIFDVVLKGEANGYNDLNFYKGGKLNSYIEGRYGKKYEDLKKPLSETTIGEVIALQKQSRTSPNGQLWATGLYQIIPTTLQGIYRKAGLSTTDLYSPLNQDKISVALLMERKNLKNYLTGKVSDTQDNLEKSATDIAMSWSSTGVPKKMFGKWQLVEKNQSFYHPKDKASVKTEQVQEAIKASRKK